MLQIHGSSIASNLTKHYSFIFLTFLDKKTSHFFTYKFTQSKFKAYTLILNMHINKQNYFSTILQNIINAHNISIAVVFEKKRSMKKSCSKII